MRVSRNIASCFGGNFGRSEELTGSLADWDTAGLDVKANWGVAATPPGMENTMRATGRNLCFNHKVAYRFFRNEITH
jgi:hypothetical protein